MQIEIKKTKVSLTFPFAAVVMLMLLICNSEVVFISLFSSLFHESGHLFFMLLSGDKPSHICLGAFGIRIERTQTRILEYKKEALIALGGVFANILLAAIGFFIYTLCASLWAAKLMAVNLFLALFNMLPVRLLDCGRFLECAFNCRFSHEKSEKVLGVVSAVTAVAVFTGCLFYNIFISVNVSMIAVSIYIILITTLKE